jgi:hypothetical protein
LIVALSCSKPGSGELVNLPLAETRGLLDSAQVGLVFEYARHFPNGTQVSMCILTGDSEKYVGIRRLNDSLVYVHNSDSVFEIGSITKTFTGTMLARLAYDGTVDINEPVRKFLPVPLRQSSLNGIEMTLAHLANHTSGLPFEPDNVNDDKDHPFDPYSPYRYYDTGRL